MSPDPERILEQIVSLEDVIEYGSKIALYTQTLSLDDFRSNELVFDAVVRNLELLGDAAKRVPSTLTASLPDAAWTRAAAFADVIARHSVTLDRQIVWDLVKTKIPELVRSSIAALERLRRN